MARLDKPVLDELIQRFSTPNAAEGLLRRASFPVDRLTQNTSARAMWTEVDTLVSGGLVQSPVPIVQEALQDWPYNPIFGDWMTRAVPPPPVSPPPPPPPPPRVRGRNEPDGPAPQVAVRPATGYVVTINSPGLTVQQVLAVARGILHQINVQTQIDLGLANDQFVALELPEAPADAVARLADQLATLLNISPRRVSVRSNTFRDYFLQRLTLEGPDQRRFDLEEVPASTPIREVARGVMNGYYQDNNWPADPNGKPKEAVVTRVEADGKPHQLQGDRSLHENGVREGSTLHVSPRVTAGSINPVMREEALARVYTQLQNYAAAHPGFTLRANVIPKPTSYLIEFDAPGFAPPAGPGEPPRFADRHTVRIDLGPDFPMTAPLVLWRSPVYHPNIDSKSGKVCLGALESDPVTKRNGYRPGLDFGDLCQMLVDIAGYQNYEVGAGGYYNPDAREWAVSPDGEALIESRGGRSMTRAAVDQWLQDAHEPPPLRITPL